MTSFISTNSIAVRKSCLGGVGYVWVYPLHLSCLNAFNKHNKLCNYASSKSVLEYVTFLCSPEQSSLPPPTPGHSKSLIHDESCKTKNVRCSSPVSRSETLSSCPLSPIGPHCTFVAIEVIYRYRNRWIQSN